MKPRRDRVPRRLRLRLTTASFLLSTVVVAGAVGALIGALQHDIDVSVQSRLRDRAAALAATVDIVRGTVDITGADDALLDTPNWVFDRTGRQVEGLAPGSREGKLVLQLGRARGPIDAQSGTLHFRALPVQGARGIVAVVVTAVDEAPYQDALGATTGAAVLFGVFVVLGATGLTALVLSRSLGPIASMTTNAAEWSRIHSARRFALGPARDELTGLAAVLDDLLDRVEEALATERRLTAEIAHELRSPLTLLMGEADLALMNAKTPPSELPRYQRIREASTAMARALTTLLDAPSPDDGARSDAEEAVSMAVSTLDTALPIRFEGSSTAVAVEFARLERMIAPLLVNAVAAARSFVRVQVREAGDSVLIVISDDGPGIDPTVASSLFEPGVTTKATGTGLGLALSRRLARESGGDLELVSSRPAAFVLRLPRTAANAPNPHGLRSDPHSVKAG